MGFPGGPRGGTNSFAQSLSDRRMQMYLRPLLAAALLTAATAQASAAVCSTDTPFTQAPVDLSSVSHIVPLGNLNPEKGHTIPTRHIYVYPKSGAALEVQSPGDVEIVAVVFHPVGSDPNNAAQEKDEWELHLKPCEGVTLYFNHIVDLNKEIVGKFQRSNPVKLDKLVATPVSIALASGSPIGNAKTFDIGLVDMRKPALSFANPTRYAANIEAVLAKFGLSASITAKAVVPRIVPQALYSRCALDYFIPDIKQQMIEKLASSDGATKAQANLPCNSHMQDISGSAQGNWWSTSDPTISFLSDETAVSLSNSNVDSNVPVFSLNSETPGSIPAGIYQFAVGPSTAGEKTAFVNRRFSEIKDTAIYCYEGLAPHKGGPALDGIVLLQLERYRSVTANRMRIEFLKNAKSCSNLAQRTMGPGATLLYR